MITCAVVGSQPMPMVPARNCSWTVSSGALSTSSTGVLVGTLQRLPSTSRSRSRISSIFCASRADCSFSRAMLTICAPVRACR